MRKGLMSILMMLSFLIASGATVARAQVSAVIEADIPFSFHILDTQLPAGRYEIRRLDNEPNLLAITNLDEKSTMLFVTHDARTNEPASKCELLFNKYGDETFLSKIFEEGDSLGIEVMKSRMEKRLEHSAELAERPAVPFRWKS